MPAKKQVKSYRKVHLVINNPDISPDQALEIARSFKSLTYCALGLEVAPTTGTPHLHIYLCFKSSVQESTLKRKFSKAHIERAKGTPQDNRDYIQKTGKYKDSAKADTVVLGSFREYGTIPGPPKPSRKTSNTPAKSQGVVQMIEDGKSDRQIIRENPGFLGKQKMLDGYRSSMMRDISIKRMAPLEIVYIYGLPGSGKTDFVYAKHEAHDIYQVTDYLNPYDGYHSEPVILYDMFQDLPKEFWLGDLVRVLSPHGVQLPARGQNRWACFTKVYFTSCYSPTDVFMGKNGPTLDSFLNRINHVVRMEAGTPTDFGPGKEWREATKKPALAPVPDSPILLDGYVPSTDASAVA